MSIVNEFVDLVIPVNLKSGFSLVRFVKFPLVTPKSLKSNWSTGPSNLIFNWIGFASVGPGDWGLVIVTPCPKAFTVIKKRL